MTERNVTRDELVGAILKTLCSTKSLPPWLQMITLGRNMTPLAEVIADSILESEFITVETKSCQHPYTRPFSKSDQRPYCLSCLDIVEVSKND